MNIASVSEAVSSSTWSTPQASSTTQAWPSSSGYEQYYNYYQNVPPPVATTVAATTTTYQQDYSQAWDEYYKAYYGQSYAAPVTTTTTTQYNPSYSYDQYGYANFSAPPPNYYESGQSTGYDYTQTSVSGSSAYPTYNTIPSTSIPPTTNWSEPPPTFAQPSTYNALQTYEQSQNFSQPPPISLSYESSVDPNNIMQGSSGEEPFSEYYDQQSNKHGKYNSNMETDHLVNPQKEASYLEQFPPPSFGSPIKPNNRVRGLGNLRGRPQIPVSRNNFNQGKNQLINRGVFGSKINDRRQFSSNDLAEENLQFNHSQTNNIVNRRGNRGGFNANRGRGTENKGFQQSVSELWYQEEASNSKQNESSYLQRDYENQDYFDQNYNDNNQEYDDGYFDWQQNKGHSNFENQDYPKGDFESNYPRMEITSQKYQFNSNEQRPNNSNVHSRNGGYFSNDRQPSKPSNTERLVRPLMSTPRQPVFRTQNSILNKPPIKLMDVVVELSVQSPVIQRRQNIIDQWQREVKELHNRRVPVKLFWPVLKSSLSTEIQKLLLTNCFTQIGSVVCELVIDDIFLVQSKGENEEIAIESASKILFEMLKNKVFVKTCTRDVGGDKVPGFCISSNILGQVSLPNSYKSDSSRNAFQKEDDSSLVVKSIGQFSDPGIFLVIEPSTNERDQSIASLVATARFNNCIVDYQHEKLPHAPHISSCVITIDGKEIERHEARDYLVAKRQAADKVIAKLKQTRPQITLRLDKAKQVKKEDLKKEESFENSIAVYLQNFANSKEDILLKFDSDFSSDEKNTLISVASNLNLTFKSEGKHTLFVFKQFSILEMKSRLVGQGYCAQYQLIEKGSDFSSQ